MNIGILEDETEQQALYHLWLSSANHTCSCFGSVKEFIDALQQQRFDMLILDWMLPESSGPVALKWIRENLGWDLPVLFVTGRDNESDIVTALKAGADDYLVKPPKLLEFLTRIEVLGRRVKRPAASQYGNYRIDFVGRGIALNGKTIELTNKEFDLACYLFQNPDKLLSRVKLLEELWGISADIDTRTIDNHMSRVKKKLALGRDNGWQVVAVHGWGYRFEKIGNDTPTSPAALANPAKKSTISALAQYLPLPGIDSTDGLNRTMGNEKLYLRMLLKFRDGQSDFAKKFAIARVEGNDDTDVRIAHDLKSNAGNIGAKGVQLAAAKLEIACMEKSPVKIVDGLLKVVLTELDRVIKGLTGVKT